MEKKKIHKLEAIRGFAAIYVVLHHSFAHGIILHGIDFSFLFHFGQEAVIIFFVLSGFVIKYSFEKSKDKSFGVYFQKRFLRIFIPIIIVYATDYLVQVWQKHYFFQINWGSLLGNILMLQDNGNLKPNVIVNPFLVNTPLWSLSYEWWFYMLFFFITVRYKSKANNIVYILAIISAVSYLFYPFFINRIFLYLAIWWIGIAIAELHLNQQSINLSNLKKPLLITLALLILLLFNAKLNHYDGIAHGIGYSPWLEVRQFAFAIFAILIALLWKKMNWKCFSSTIGRFEIFSSISFVVYISHYFLIVQASYLDFIKNSFFRFILYFAICIGYSILIEKIIYPKIRGILTPNRNTKVRIATKIELPQKNR